MRIALRSNFQTQFTSSFAGIINVPAPVPQLTASSSSTYTRGQYNPTPVQPAKIVAPVVAVAAVPASASAPSSSQASTSSLVTAITPPVTSSIDSEASLSLNQSQDGNLFSIKPSTPGITTEQIAPPSLPSFSTLQEQSQMFGLNPTNDKKGSESVSGSVTPSLSSSMSGMLGGMSMGGMTAGTGGKVDIEAIRLMQMQSVKELSAALKVTEPTSIEVPINPDPAISSGTEINSSAQVPAADGVTAGAVLEENVILSNASIIVEGGDNRMEVDDN